MTLACAIGGSLREFYISDQLVCLILDNVRVNVQEFGGGFQSLRVKEEEGTCGGTCRYSPDLAYLVDPKTRVDP